MVAPLGLLEPGLGAISQRHPGLRRRRKRVPEALRHHADDRVGGAVGTIGRPSAAPAPPRRRAARLELTIATSGPPRRRRPRRNRAHGRRDAEHAEVIGAHTIAVEPLRVATAATSAGCQRSATARRSNERLRSAIAVSAVSHRQTPAFRVAVGQRDDALRLRIRQRREQDRTHGAEHGRTGSDAERDARDREQREAGAASNRRQA